MSTLNERIKELRKQKGLTQSQLADMVGVSDKAVSKWEVGETNPDITMLPELSKIFDVSIDYLLTGKMDETISLDDMDEEKRLLLLFKKDDVDSFNKYKYIESKFIFNGNTNYQYNLRFKAPNLQYWKEMISNNARNIFGICCDEIIKMNEKKVWAAFLIYDIIDDFVKMVVDIDRADVLETIGFRIFAIGERKGIPFVNNQTVRHYISNVDTYFIKDSTFDYIFKNRENSPKCFEYATTLELKITGLNTNRQDYTFTHLENVIVEYSIKYKYYDIVEKMLQHYKDELNNPSFEEYYNRRRDGFRISLQNSYVLEGERVIGRAFSFKMDSIKLLLSQEKVELAKKLNSYNKLLADTFRKYISNNTGEVDKIEYLTESEIDRFLKLNGDISEDEKLKLLCVKEHIIVASEFLKLRDLTLAREIVDNNYYHYYEFAYDCLTKNKQAVLYKFLIDNDFNDLASLLISSTDGDYSKLLAHIWNVFNLKPGYGCYAEHKSVIENRNDIKTNRDNYITLNGRLVNVTDDRIVTKDDSIVNYLRELKENLYESVKKQVEADEQAKQDAIDRAKAVKGLTREYFEGLLAKKGLFAKKEQRLFILDLCSLFDAILKFDFKCNGEDFFERMNNYFDNGPKSRTTDDGWGYQVHDTKYENEVVKPWNETRELFNRLRIQRNNIAHSESKKVDELTEEELRKCLDYVFSINKEDK